MNVQDSLALVDLYNNTNGPGWNNHANWLTGPVKKWYGINVTNTRVTYIGLEDNQLSGIIPSSIGNLTGLTTLDFYDNELSGSIPPSIGNLVQLTYLGLQYNQLTDSIPSSIGNLLKLTFLEVSYNLLTDSIPSSIGNLAKLTTLGLDNNQLSGSIPSSIGNLVNLTGSFLNHNKLSGSIPSSIGNLTQLTYLDLSLNQLSGTIPSSIGNLVKLISLYLEVNRLGGPIPSSIGNLVSLYWLILSNNQLTGGIPASFKKLKFSFFDVSYNQLTESSNVNVFTRTVIDNADLNNNYFTFNGLESAAMDPRIIITYAPQAAIAIHQSGNVLSVSAGGTLSNNTYKWFSTGSKDSTTIIGDSTFHPLKNGMYYAHVTNAIATKLTLYTDTVNYTMPLAHSEMNAVDIKAINNHFSVYPNPAKDILQVQTKGNASISLLNQDGKILLTENISNTGSINVSGMPADIYYLKNNNTNAVQKIFIVR